MVDQGRAVGEIHGPAGRQAASRFPSQCLAHAQAQCRPEHFASRLGVPSTSSGPGGSGKCGGGGPPGGDRQGFHGFEESLAVPSEDIHGVPPDRHTIGSPAGIASGFVEHETWLGMEGLRPGNPPEQAPGIVPTYIPGQSRCPGPAPGVSKGQRCQSWRGLKTPAGERRRYLLSGNHWRPT